MNYDTVVLRVGIYGVTLNDDVMQLFYVCEYVGTTLNDEFMVQSRFPRGNV